jgi:acetyl-CoA/propionyl-CoA carboxylase biotin carboxyl carrier protein
MMRKVLIANRGEVAVRVARACRDAGMSSVAVYTEPDREAPHVTLADEAFALCGDTPSRSHLDIAAILTACRASGADAVHPGWGFLAENAEFAEAVIAAGLTWIGPPPQVIRALGDKVSARQIAWRVGAPLAPGTPDAVSSAEEVLTFTTRHGLPVAVKAANGGGGRGLRVARTREEIPECFASAVRETKAAFGRGDCFAERYLDRARHVETQCLADAHGTVVVVSTRDCSLQRRHQKLVEEAPAPFLTDAQVAALYAASKAIMSEAGYVGAGTCEFLIGEDGMLSFLEVNTRLQVEHPVSEEVTGLDLVLEMFRIAEGEPLGYDDPEVRGHSLEFRVNGEDPGRGFLPAPGVLTRWRPPSGPGVRVDSGVKAGTAIGQAFDSLLAKLIVTGRDRNQALARARRALAEFEVAGLPTVLPFHRAVANDPAFVAPGGKFRVHTRWIEDDFNGQIDPYAEPGQPGPPESETEHQTVVLEVNRRRVEVTLPARGAMSAGRAVPGPARRRSAAGGVPAPDAREVVSPMQGVVVKVAVGEGDEVAEGALILILEAMKMEQPVLAPRAGTVQGLAVESGVTVSAGTVLCTLGDGS